MADYYTLLSRAVSNLPKPSPAAARKAIYDRARKALMGQLRSLKPALPESDIAREESALDAAVARLEAELEPPGAPPPPAELPSPAAPRRPPAAAPVVRAVEPPRAPPAPVVPPRAVAPGPLRPPLAATAAAAVAARPLAPAAPLLKPRAPLAPAPQVPAAPAAPPPAPPVPRATPEPVKDDAPPPPLVSARPADPAGPDAAPRIDALREPSAPRGEAEAMRPSAANLDAPRRGQTWPWIAAAAGAGLVGSITAAALLWPQKPGDLVVKPEDTETPAPQTPAGPKIKDRVGGVETPVSTPGADALAPAPASPAPLSPAPPRAPPTPVASAVPAAAPNAIASPAPAPAAPAVLPVSARAAMLVATAADAQKPAVTVGTAVWSAVPALPGQPGSVGVKAEIEIPDLKMHASMTLRKNGDPALPASHTIDLRINFDEGSSIKGVKDINLPRMRRDDSPNADAMLGVKVKINDSYFLIGLNPGEADVTRNLDEIATRGWFDFPLLLNDDRIAKLTFEKAADGERVINDAIAAWK